ncbi:MAG: SRPBCC family protein [Albidovulum sp.]
MKLSTRREFDAQPEEVFEALSDFIAFEKLALRHGADVQRIDHLAAPGLGAEWVLQFPFRGRSREVKSRINAYDPPIHLGAEGTSGSFDFTLRTTLEPLRRDHTRLAVELEVKPRTFAARLMLQTLKLGKSRLDARFATRIERFVSAMLSRQKRAQTG